MINKQSLIEVTESIKISIGDLPDWYVEDCETRFEDILETYFGRVYRDADVIVSYDGFDEVGFGSVTAYNDFGIEVWDITRFDYRFALDEVKDAISAGKFNSKRRSHS